MTEKIREIPYGEADFEKIRLKDKYFIDKTRFIHILEKYEYIFLIRPRRFGKSLWLSILQSYYDIAHKDRFDFFFKGTDIGKNPTDERNSYLIMRFDFSKVKSNPQIVEESFEEYCARVFRNFLKSYKNFFEEDFFTELEECSSASDKLDCIISYAGLRKLKIYILIDEYDNFANNIIADSGKRAYHDVSQGHGFFRHFFAVLKGGTSESGSGLGRLFITGVSPITLDDVTSGFNIGDNISLSVAFNEILGFTEDEVKKFFEYYKTMGLFKEDIGRCMDIMHQWYNGYIFSEKASTTLFNTDMVLFFFKETLRDQSVPDSFIDHNIRTDYKKLHRLTVLNRQLNGNFNHLKKIIEDRRTVGRITKSFPLEELSKPENFVSLLYYFGLLTFRGVEMGDSVLAVPNRAVWGLMYEYIREAYRDVDVFGIDIFDLAGFVREMAWLGKWKEFFDFLAKEVKEQTSIHDYLGKEKIVQGFLLAYMGISDFLIPHTEAEMNKGYCDFFLEPFLTKYPEIPFGYIIELKYIKRSDLTDSVLKKSITEAKTQIQKYAKDRKIVEKYKKCKIIKLILIYHGWEMISAIEI